MIGIDPHKGSHTAFVIDGREKELGQLRVRASSKQAEALLGWAGRWRQRTCAIEGEPLTVSPSPPADRAPTSPGTDEVRRRRSNVLAAAATALRAS
jgi:hypothetical protein